MQKKKSATIIALIAAVASGGIALSFDFSQTTISNITGDTINNFLENKGITLDDLRTLCTNEQLDIFKEYEEECKFLELLP